LTEISKIQIDGIGKENNSFFNEPIDKNKNEEINIKETDKFPIVPEKQVKDINNDNDNFFQNRLSCNLQNGNKIN